MSLGDLLARLCFQVSVRLGRQDQGLRMKSAILLTKKVVHYRTMILAMAWVEIRKRYAGTIFGVSWNVIHPIMMVLVYGFIFSVGFRVQPAGGWPFVLVFLSGVVPWMTFSEILTQSACAVTNNPHLVKKTAFPTEILPLVCIGSSLINHAVMLLILSCTMLVYGRPLSLHCVQVVYYATALCAFSLGLAWLVCALNVYARDVGQALGVVLNFWFWLTPVVWQLDMLQSHPRYRFLLELNPMCYILDGYRNSFLYQKPLWENPGGSLYFWLTTLFLAVMGGLVFRQLKPDFADVL